MQAKPTPEILLSGRGTISRIHVTGGAASGKTTFARRVGGALKLPILDLDSGAFQLGPDSRYEEQRQQLLRCAQDKSRWISDGSYVGWATRFMELADLIIFLDAPASAAYRRVILRHWRASLRRDNQYKGIRKLLRFLLRTRDWYSSTRTRDESYGVPAGTTGITHLEDLRNVLMDFESKVITCRTKKDAERLLHVVSN